MTNPQSAREIISQEVYGMSYEILDIVYKHNVDCILINLASLLPKEQDTDDVIQGEKRMFMCGWNACLKQVKQNLGVNNGK